MNEELLKRAEELAESEICKIKCLCPDLKEEGLCSGCEVFLALRDYYIQKLEGEIE